MRRAGAITQRTLRSFYDDQMTHHAAALTYVTPDVEQRSFRWVTPGAAAGVLLWLIASLGLSIYISNIAGVGAA